MKCKKIQLMEEYNSLPRVIFSFDEYCALPEDCPIKVAGFKLRKGYNQQVKLDYYKALMARNQ